MSFPALLQVNSVRERRMKILLEFLNDCANMGSQRILTL